VNAEGAKHIRQELRVAVDSVSIVRSDLEHAIWLGARGD
jgi:hypothetical protein